MRIDRVLPLVLIVGIVTPRASAALELETRNVILVTADGIRWQEVFSGADAALIDKENGGVAEVEATRRDYWRESPVERREILFPFLWSVVAEQGQLIGDREEGRPARVTNGKNFSYPGYNELLTGSADPRIDSNDLVNNPNVTVLEWLNSKEEYRNRVAAVCSWNAFPYIINRDRSGIPVNAAWEPIAGEALTEGQVTLNRMMGQAPRIWSGCRDDSYTFQVALEQFRKEKPRVFYIGLGDTDEHAHEGHYDKYLRACRTLDDDLRLIWEEAQASPEYAGRTSLIVTTDHGRGDAPVGWKSHGARIAGSEAIWVGILGPDTSPDAPGSGGEEVTQSQIAATIAALLGEDYQKDVPSAAPPIAVALPRR